jgi:hypothetical protein
MSSSQSSKARPTEDKQRPRKELSLSAIVSSIVLLGIAVAWLAPSNLLPWRSGDIRQTTTGFTEVHLDPHDYAGRARQILRSTPLIDGHNDFPYLLRHQLHNKIYDHDFEKERLGSQTDFQKMKKGLMGGQFWSVFVPCPEDLLPGVDPMNPNKRVPELNEPNVRTK